MGFPSRGSPLLFSKEQRSRKQEMQNKNARCVSQGLGREEVHAEKMVPGFLPIPMIIPVHHSKGKKEETKVSRKPKPEERRGC